LELQFSRDFIGLAEFSAVWEQNMEELREVTLQLSLEDIRPFLMRVTRYIPSGFDREDVLDIIEAVEEMEAEEEEEFAFDIFLANIVEELRIRICMNEQDTPEFHIYAPEALCAKIEFEKDKITREFKVAS
jgi:hypothetical protein